MFLRRRKKIFVIGRNKTGTTSLRELFEGLGLMVGDQREAEELIHDWGNGEFSELLDYCKAGEVFQDVPFSFGETYKVVDEHFPGSRFILTKRGSSDEWFDSLCRFHTKIVGKNRLPTWEDLESFDYCWKGWLLEVQILNYGVTRETLYDPALYKEHYESYNQMVAGYFVDRPNDLLVLDLAKEEGARKLADFLSLPVDEIQIPHANRSQ